MANVSVYNMDGQEVGTMELSDEIFAAPVKENLVHQAVVLHLANMRQGTQKAKTRSEVSGGGIKPWRQKGTGHARQGSIRAPQWRHGGVVFAPVPRDYSFKMNRKEKRAALKSVLTSKLQENNLIVVDSIAFDDIKTKNMVRVMKALKAEKAYVVLNGADRNVFLSTRNLPNVRLSQAGTLSVYDILKYEKLVLTQDAVRTIEEVFA
ncbi:MAG: 50S ribosomal protein L4 [Clostridiales bacterium]|nr:50S ribosomal protein L4 [Clostridiales bacterium]